MPNSEDVLIIEAFHNIPDKNMLGWVALDTKFERFVLAAIMAEINRRHRRIAHVEFPPRTDLVLLEHPIPLRAGLCLDSTHGRVRKTYEAKAGQLFDFAPGQGTKNEYLGGALNRDIGRLRPGTGAGLFFISDADDPSRSMKYYRGNKTDLATAVAVLQTHIAHGQLVATETIDCGNVDGAGLRIHMCVFDRT